MYYILLTLRSVPVFRGILLLVMWTQFCQEAEKKSPCVPMWTLPMYFRKRMKDKNLDLYFSNSLIFSPTVMSSGEKGAKIRNHYNKKEQILISLFSFTILILIQ